MSKSVAIKKFLEKAERLLIDQRPYTIQHKDWNALSYWDRVVLSLELIKKFNRDHKTDKGGNILGHKKLGDQFCRAIESYADEKDELNDQELEEIYKKYNVT